MSPDQETEDREATEEQQGDGEDMSAAEKAQQEAKEREKAAEQVEQMEDDPPTDLSEWPSDKAKYITFGGPEGDHGYEEGPEQNLGPTEVRHHEDGRVTVSGEEVDPDDYKGEPIPGGPTDPNTPSMSGEDDDEEDDGGSTGSAGPGSQNGQTGQEEDEEE